MMETNKGIVSDLKEKFAEGISEKVVGIGPLPPWPCLALGCGEPKMPDELIMEGCKL